MRIPLAVSAAALIAIAAAACSGGQSSNYVAPPAAGTAVGSSVTNSAVTLSQTATIDGAGTANGITGALTFGSGSGTVTVSSSGTAFAGTVAVVPAAKNRIVLASSPTSPVVYYVAIATSSGAMLSGLPAVSLSLSSPAVGTYQEAMWNGTQYLNVSGATATMNAAGTALTFPAGATAITLPPNGTIYLAFYQGNFPNATPTPVALPSNVLADSNFESGVTAPLGTAVTTTGWTVCAVTTPAPGAAKPARAFSSFTPSPTSSFTPAAGIRMVGASAPAGSATPIATQTTVPVTSGQYAAVFGGQFNNQQYEDYRYNGLCQSVTVPFNATMTANVFAQGNDGSSFFDFEVAVLNSSGQMVADIFEDKNPIAGPSTPGDTAYRAITVPTSAWSPYAGQTVTLFIGTWIDGGSATGATTFAGYYFVDDVLLIGTKS